MRAAAIVAALLLAAGASGEGDARRMVEITANLVQIRPDGSGASLRGTPGVTCPDGVEAKLFIGRNEPDGTPDPRAIRVEFTPRILEDGRVEIKVVSLGTELGEQPDAIQPVRASGTDAKLSFHSALPSDNLFSVAGRNGHRSWLRIGQRIDGWTLIRYDATTRTLWLSTGGRTQQLTLAKAGLAEPKPSGPRIETVTVQPGQSAEIVGKDGHRMVLSARVYDEEPAR